MNILITNDDGINADGLIELKKALEKEHNIYIIAPLKEQSGSSHSLTMNLPLRVYEYGKNFYAVDGTPTDCVMLGLNKIYEGIKFDLLVSGINYGANLGDDLTYSGTVAGAMEGCLMGIPSIALSIDVDFQKRPVYIHYETAIQVLKILIENGLKFKKDTFLNINVPDKPLKKLKGIKITRQGKRTYKDVIVENVDPRGEKYYWIAGTPVVLCKDEDTDIFAVENDYVSITPVKMDLTDYDFMNELNNFLTNKDFFNSAL